MPGIRNTAYPQLKAAPSVKELNDVYTPNFVELVCAEKRTRESAPRFGLLTLLKTFQRLGYFVPLCDVPAPILEHIARSAGYSEVPQLERYDTSSARRRHMLLVRDYGGVKAWDEDARKAMATASRDAALSGEARWQLKVFGMSSGNSSNTTISWLTCSSITTW